MQKDVSNEIEMFAKFKGSVERRLHGYEGIFNPVACLLTYSELAVGPRADWQSPSPFVVPAGSLKVSKVGIGCLATCLAHICNRQEFMLFSVLFKKK